ncbi:MAG: M16 family metallopeptidase [Planctomycetota bacterium]|jgi:zinc protease
MRRVLVFAFLCLALVSGPNVADAADVSEFELENGLQVILRPLPLAQQVAVLVLYDFGEDHDPQGQSGLAHMVEHCYVTAAAGDAPARTAEEMMAAYPNAWQAQTGSDYTVIAFVATPDRLEAEVKSAAARMGDLRITEADLQREKPRLLHELHNMFEAVPALAAQNRAREMVRPSAGGARKGGMPDQVNALTLEQVQQYHARYYKPGNARLVIAGKFTPRQAEDLVITHFNDIPRGSPLPPARPRPAPRFGSMETMDAAGAPPGTPGFVCLAFAAPSYGSPQAAAFQLLTARFLRAQMLQGVETPVQVQWAMLDDPAVVFAYGPIAAGEDPDAKVGEAMRFIQEIAKGPLQSQDARFALDTFSYFLATRNLNEMSLGINLYGTAFGLGRRSQLGVDGAAVAARLNAVTQAELEAAARAIFAPEKSVAAVVVPQSGGPR